jgi:hypothetical protein
LGLDKAWQIFTVWHILVDQHFRQSTGGQGYVIMKSILSSRFSAKPDSKKEDGRVNRKL